MDKPLASAQLEPTYRKGGECWSEGTGRGSSRAFLGTLSLKFVLETEEKTRELLWADEKGLYSKIHTCGIPGTALESPTMPCPPQVLPPPQCRHLLPLEPASLKPWEWSNFGGMSGAYQGSSSRRTLILQTGLTLSFTICGFPGTRKDDTSQLWY